MKKNFLIGLTFLLGHFRQFVKWKKKDEVDKNSNENRTMTKNPENYSDKIKP